MPSLTENDFGILASSAENRHLQTLLSRVTDR
jgi:hypothetical protein